ncbi:MAG: hypothetical protein ACJAS9_004016 [Polaribacter sp.]|jgi:hypothetical protein
MVWRNTDDKWEINRVLSYGHRENDYKNVTMSIVNIVK